MQKPKIELLNSKELFLLKFTRELIGNSGAITELKELLKGKHEEPPKKEYTPEVKEKDQFPLIKSILSQKSNAQDVSMVGPVRLKSPRKEIMEQINTPNRPVLTIPEPKLPEEFEYLKPVPTRKEIDLGKLNPLINDMMVKTIECEGPNKQIIVTGGMGRKPTNIALSIEEVNQVIDKFSIASKIPVDIGVYKVVVGSLIFSAIISDIVPSRFIIQKMTLPNNTVMRPIAPMPPAIPKINRERNLFLPH